MSKTDKPVLIPEVQYLRALAVLLVVFAHIHQHEARFFSQALLGDAAYFGFGGVDVFFVISGYIIHRLYGHHHGLNVSFFVNRANRIYPLYWIFTGAALLGYAVMGDSLTADAGTLNLVSSLTLAPAGQPPILMVGWTLTHELYFYLAYGLFLALPGRWRVWAAAGWGALSLVMAILPGQPASPWVALLVSPFNLFFLAGMAIAAGQDRLASLRWPALALMLAGLAGGLYWSHRTGLDGLTDPALRVAVLAPFAIGVVAAALAWAPRLPASFRRIGDWSYAIYLSHILLIGVLARLMPRFIDGAIWQSPLFYLVCLAGCLALGWISHQLLERPLLRAGKAAIRRLIPG